MEELLKNSKGITLVALVITIIILLILSAVTLGTLFGENGILKRTENAKLETEKAQVLEDLRLEMAANTMSYTEKLEDLTYLKQTGKVKTNSEINVAKINNNMSSGRGSLEEGDVYYLDAGYLYYMDSNKESFNLGKIYNVEGVLTEEDDIFIYEDTEETIIIGIKSEYKKETWEKAYAVEPVVRIYDKDGNQVTNIIIPSRVVEIKEKVFQYCRYLEKIELSENIVKIGNYAFAECESLKTLNIPSKVTTIGDYAFYYCTTLTSLNIPNNVTSIGKSAFNYCTNITNFEIPTWNVSIGDYAFGSFKKITSVEIPANWTTIPNGAFYGWESLKNITIPEHVTEIGEWAFGYCYDLEEIVIPSNITTIGDLAFRWCTGLKNIEIQEGVTKIGRYAFAGLSSELTSITIPNSVETIDENAFSNLNDSQTINILGKASEADFTSVGEDWSGSAVVKYENATT